MKPSTVLITGANRGIGLELVRCFLSSGDWAIIACCRDPDSADDLQRLAASSDGKVGVHRLDVTDDRSIWTLAEALSGRRVDVLLNNAGIMGGDRQSAFDTDHDAWINAFRVNTLAPLRMAQCFIDNLRLSDRPRIVTLSSQMASLNRKSKGSYIYRSSKAAMNKVMQVLALDLEDDGIIVSMIHPGWVKTDMGGKDAEISPQDSAAGLFDVITTLEPSHSGRFLQWTGQEHPW